MLLVSIMVLVLVCFLILKWVMWLCSFEGRLIGMGCVVMFVLVIGLFVFSCVSLCGVFCGFNLMVNICGGMFCLVECSCNEG